MQQTMAQLLEHISRLPTSGPTADIAHCLSKLNDVEKMLRKHRQILTSALIHNAQQPSL
ncbi:MAG: hypothetical protein [Microvirus sp.]|nr:MAG: hypothetical protein [Microvirus sp.]